MKRSLIVVSALVVGLAATASAQGQGPGPRAAGFGLFAFDTNADGRLTRVEFDAAQKARFDALDSDRNGVITAQERRAVMEAQREAAKAARFAALDTDGDGKLSPAELDNARGAYPRAGRRGPDRARFGGPGAARGGGADLTFAAFSERAGRAFEAADTNKDGVVTIAEVQALRPRR